MGNVSNNRKTMPQNHRKKPGIWPGPEIFRLSVDKPAARVGVEGKRARPLRELARVAKKVDRASEPVRLLSKLPGFGVWSLAQIAGSALGNADAVPLGDYGLPHLVSYAMAGEPRGDDQRMLELLEPYKGHRYRVIRWLEASGIEAPRFGPKVAKSQALG